VNIIISLLIIGVFITFNNGKELFIKKADSFEIRSTGSFWGTITYAKHIEILNKRRKVIAILPTESVKYIIQLDIPPNTQNQKGE